MRAVTNFWAYLVDGWETLSQPIEPINLDLAA